MAKILLVEDDNNLREIYEARLLAEGYTIVSAQDGEQALVVAKSEKPDLIIADVMMPKISGFEMLDILRNTDGLKDVSVVMLTALGQSEDQQRADRLGADRYLVKSQVTLEDIVKVVEDILSGESAAPKPSTVSGAKPVEAEPTPAMPVVSAPAETKEAAKEQAVTTETAAPEPEPELVAAPIAAPTIPAPASVADIPEPEEEEKPAEPVETPEPTPVAAPPLVPDKPTEEKVVESKVAQPVVVEALTDMAAPEPVVEPETTTTPDTVPFADIPEPEEEEKPAEPVETPEPDTPAELEVKPEPEPVKELPKKDEAVVSTAKETASNAQSTKEEEAGVEAQIEDFVEGATTEADPPAAATPKPEAVSEPPSPAKPEEPESEPATTDAKEPVETPEPDTPAELEVKPEPDTVKESPSPPKAEEPEPGEPEPEAVSETPEPDKEEQDDPAPVSEPPAPAATGEPEPVPVNEPVLEEAEETVNESTEDLPSGAAPKEAPQIIGAKAASSQVDKEDGPGTTAASLAAAPRATVAGKKVIVPPNSEPKPDLNKLLALEEAEEVAKSATVKAAEPAAQVVTMSSEETIDPNSIAL